MLCLGCGVECLCLGLGGGGLGGALEVFFDLRAFLPHLFQGHVCGAGELALVFLSEFRGICLLSEGGLKCGHLAGVLGGVWLDGAGFFSHVCDGFFLFGHVGSGFGLALGLLEVCGDALHHFADFGREAGQGFTSGGCLFGKCGGDVCGFFLSL